MTFSWAGVIVAIAILAPNLLMAVFPPREGVGSIVSAGLPFTILERAGQVGCLALLCVTPFGAIDVWFWAMIVFIAAYYALWVRYLVGARRVALLFEPVLRIPIPMALLPVFAFASAAAWGRSPWMGIAVVVLAVGHWANSWASYRAQSASA